MERSWFVSAGVGGALFVTGLLMMRSHYRTWQSQKSDPELDPSDITFLRRRYRRRMQASGLMSFIGIMLPIGDSVERFAPAPAWFALYWIVVLVLVLWLFLLGAGDWASTKAHSTVSLNKIRSQQRRLEREAADLRKQLMTRKNGSRRSGTEESDAG